MIKDFVKSNIGKSIYRDNGEIHNEFLCSIYKQSEKYFDCESQEYYNFVKNALLLFGIKVLYISAENEMNFDDFDKMMESETLHSWDTVDKRMLSHTVEYGDVKVEEFHILEKYFTEDGAIAGYFILLD